MLDEVFGSRLLSASTDLADHDYSVAFRIFEKHFQTIDEVSAVEGVTTDADAQRLSKTGLQIKSMSE